MSLARSPEDYSALARTLRRQAAVAKAEVGGSEDGRARYVEVLLRDGQHEVPPPVLHTIASHEFSLPPGGLEETDAGAIVLRVR